MGKWALGISVVDTRDENNYTISSWIMLEGVTLTRATTLMFDIQEYAKLEEYEELNFVMAKDKEEEVEVIENGWEEE